LTRGDNAGSIGKIQEIKEGTFSLPKRVIMSVDSRLLEIPIDMIMVVSDPNDNNPKIKVNEWCQKILTIQVEKWKK